MNDRTRSTGSSNQGGGVKPDDSAPGLGTCPDADLLAAYVEGTIGPDEHRKVEVHLADCPTCREVVAEVVLARDELGASADGPAAAPTPGRVVSFPGRARRWWPVLGLLAAAGLVLTLVAPRVWRASDPSARPELAELVAANGAWRPFEARLTGGFAYGPLAPVMRAGDNAEAELRPEVAAAVARLELAAASTSDARSLAAAGSALLVAGRDDDAIRSLEQAVRLDANRATYWSDLAAAYLVRAARRGHGDDDRLALESADRAVRLAPSLPEALFNRALALERLGRIDEARAAWVKAGESADPWQAEAKRRAR